MIISFLHFDLICLFLLFDCKIVTSKKAEKGACPRVEPGTSRALSENHATIDQQAILDDMASFLLITTSVNIKFQPVR